MYREMFMLFFFGVFYQNVFAEVSMQMDNATICDKIAEKDVTSEKDVEKKCGYDEDIPTYYNKTSGECMVDLKVLILTLTEKYDTGDFDNSEDYLATKLRAEADKIFQGIIVSVILFITCASICTIAACIYCCRINYADYVLKKSIKVLAKKVGANPAMKRPKVKTLTRAMSQSCNVVVEDAGVFVV